MRATVLLAAPLVVLLSSSAARASSIVLNAGKTNGGFAVLGSLCFPAQAGDKVVIRAKASATATNTQLLLFYDDQAGSWDAFGTTQGCKAKIDLARPVCKAGGVDCDPGWDLVPGQQQQYTVSINEMVERAWTFVVANCAPGGGEMIEEPVQLDSLTITSSTGVPCSQLSPGASEGAGVASAIAITMLVLLLLLFVSISMVFYKRAKTLEARLASGGALIGGGGGSGSRSGGTGARIAYLGLGNDNEVSVSSVGHDDL